MSRDREIGNESRVSSARPVKSMCGLSRVTWIAALSSGLLMSGAIGADTADRAQDRSPGSVFKDCDSCPEMVVIPAGSFELAKPATRAGRGGGEDPRLDVRSFAIGRTEVTQGQWKAIMGSNPSKFANCGEDCPVERVSWNDAQEFIRRLRALTGRDYRLPSDVEWAYACLAGSTNKYCGSEKIDSVAWYEGNSNGTTHRVAGKQPNAWGLYDMTGNVWEWTGDCEASTVGGAGPAAGPQAGRDCKHSLRGGSWGKLRQLMESAYRGTAIAKSRAFDPVIRRSDFGLRVALTL